MKLLVFSVYDAAVGAFMSPFYARAKGEALRMFTDLANDASTNVGKHPADFVLMEVGEFDDRSGAFGLPVSPVRVIGALDCVNNQIAMEAEVEDRGRSRLRS
jgi:hypothetical protein